MSATNAPDSSSLGHILWNWISNSTASRSDDFSTQMTCYAFPYGALGFTAHLAMFYGIVLSSFNRCPWKYSRPLEHSKYDMAFGIIGLVISCVFTTITMYRCSGAKYYMLIAVSKFLMTISSTAVGLHIAWNIRGRAKLDDDDHQSQLRTTHHNALRWLAIEVVGSVLEFTGIVMLLKDNHDAVAKNKTPIMIISLCIAASMGISLGVGITWLEVRQRGQRRMEWEVRKVEERLESQQPRERAANRARDTPSGEGGAEESPRPGPRQQSRRRSGRHVRFEDAPHGSPSPVGRARDPEAQGLIAAVGEDEPGKGPGLYHYQDVFNSTKQVILVAGATFGLFATL